LRHVRRPRASAGGTIFFAAQASERGSRLFASGGIRVAGIMAARPITAAVLLDEPLGRHLDQQALAPAIASAFVRVPAMRLPQATRSLPFRLGLGGAAAGLLALFCWLRSSGGHGSPGFALGVQLVLLAAWTVFVGWLYCCGPAHDE
jgi:hypothetical protein